MTLPQGGLRLLRDSEEVSQVSAEVQTIVVRLVQVSSWPLPQLEPALLWSPLYPFRDLPRGELTNFQVGLVTSGEGSQKGSRCETVQRSSAAEEERTRHFGHRGAPLGQSGSTQGRTFRRQELHDGEVAVVAGGRHRALTSRGRGRGFPGHLRGVGRGSSGSGSLGGGHSALFQLPAGPLRA